MAIQWKETAVGNGMEGMSTLSLDCSPPLPVWVKVRQDQFVHIQRELAGGLTGIALNPYIELEKTGVMTIVSLPVHEHGIFSHLIPSFLITFFRVF